MRDQPSIEVIPEGKLSAIKDGSSNSDKDMTGTHQSIINQDDANLLTSLLDIQKDDRKRHFCADQENEVIKTPEECLHKAQRSLISQKEYPRERNQSHHNTRRTTHKTGVESKEVRYNNHYRTKKKST